MNDFIELTLLNTGHILVSISSISLIEEGINESKIVLKENNESVSNITVTVRQSFTAIKSMIKNNQGL